MTQKIAPSALLLLTTVSVRADRLDDFVKNRMKPIPGVVVVPQHGRLDDECARPPKIWK